MMLLIGSNHLTIWGIDASTEEVHVAAGKIVKHIIVNVDCDLEQVLAVFAGHTSKFNSREEAEETLEFVPQHLRKTLKIVRIEFTCSAE